MKKQTEFILRVESSKDEDSTPSDFKADLPPGLSLDPTRKWDVCLNSIIYSGNFTKYPIEVEGLQQFFTVEADRIPDIKQDNIPPPIPPDGWYDFNFNYNDIKKPPVTAPYGMNYDDMLPTTPEALDETVTIPDEFFEEEEEEMLPSTPEPRSESVVLPNAFFEESGTDMVDNDRLVRRAAKAATVEEMELASGYELRKRVRVDDFSKINDNETLFKKFVAMMNKFESSIAYNPELPERLFYHFRRNDNGVVSFRAKYDTKLWIPQTWAAMLGCGERPNDFSNVLITISKGEDYMFFQPLNHNIWTPNFMLVYANFIEYSSVGHMAAPILKVVPIEISSENAEYYRYYESKNEETHRVTHSQLNNVRFQLRKIDGHPLNFINKLQNIVITLKFISVE